MRLLKAAVLLALAGLIAASTIDLSQAQSRGESYENHGARPGMAPPVPGSALWLYRPGMCWKAKDSARQVGHYVPCSEFFKKSRRQ
jgi:hypothetical protein